MISTTNEGGGGRGLLGLLLFSVTSVNSGGGGGGGLSGLKTKNTKLMFCPDFQGHRHLRRRNHVQPAQCVYTTAMIIYWGSLGFCHDFHWHRHLRRRNCMWPTPGVCLYHSCDNILRFTGFLSWFSLAQAPKKEKARAASARFQKVLHKVLTEQALYINNLAEPQLLQLVSTPLDLISRLTEHAAVVAESWELGPVPGAQSFFLFFFFFFFSFLSFLSLYLSVSVTVSLSLFPSTSPSLPRQAQHCRVYFH